VPAGKISDRQNPTPDFPTDRTVEHGQILNRSKRQGHDSGRYQGIILWVRVTGSRRNSPALRSLPC